MSDVNNWEKHGAVVIFGGRTFVGQVDSVRASVIYLEPAYEFARQIMQGPKGQMAIANQVMPVLLLSGVTKLTIPSAGAIVIPFTALSPEERKVMLQGIRSAEELRSQMRAAESGIVLAGPGAVDATEAP